MPALTVSSFFLIFFTMVILVGLLHMLQRRSEQYLNLYDPTTMNIYDMAMVSKASRDPKTIMDTYGIAGTTIRR